MTPRVIAQVLPFRTYTKSNEFPNPAIQSTMPMIQDRDGYIWFGSQQGVYKFDGVTFTSFPEFFGQPPISISSLFEDSQGRLWIGTDGDGIKLYHQGQFTDFSDETALAHSNVLCFMEDSHGALWFSTSVGLYRYDGHETTRRDINLGITNSRILCLCEDSHGNIWFGSETGISQYDGAKLKNFTIPHGVTDKRVMSIIEDSRGNLWFGTSKGVYQYSGAGIEPVLMDTELSSSWVSHILEDSRGRIWIATIGGGVGVFDDNEVRIYKKDAGLSSNSILSVTEDREGNIWFATLNGLSVLLGEYLTTFTAARRYPANAVEGICEDTQGNIWIGTWGGGIARLQTEQFIIYTTADGLSYDIVRYVYCDSKGRLWIGTWGGGLNKYEHGIFTPYRTVDGLADDIVEFIFEDREGVIWIGTHRGGVSAFDGSRFTTYSTSDGLADNTVQCIRQDSEGKIWFGTRHGGVSIFDGRRFTTLNTADGLPHNDVRAMDIDDEGNLWFGTWGGVSRYDGSTFVTYTQAQGLSSNYCQLLLLDGDYCYVGTRNEINRIHMRHHTVQVLSPSLGFASGPSAQGASYKDSRGNLWFGGVEGLTRFVPALFFTDTIMPLIHITGLHGEEKSQLPVKDGVVLSADDHKITFDYTGLYFRDPDGLTYRCRLSPIDTTWITTSERSVTYSRLSTGAYRFEVTAVRADGVESGNTASLSFTIPSPFWARWWFLAGSAGFFIMTVIGVHKMRTAMYKRRNQELHQVILERDQELAYRREAEKTIRELDRFKENIIENANIWLSVSDIDGNVMLWNKAAENLSGYSRDQVIGSADIWKWLNPEAQQRNTPLAVHDLQYDLDQETAIRCKDGSEKILAWNVRDLTGDDDKIIGRLVLGRDITQRKKVEEQLKSLASQLSLSEERQRRSIAATLHDSIGQNLAFAKQKLEIGLSNTFAINDKQIVNEVLAILSQTIQGARSLTMELSPPILYELGLEPAIEWLVEQVRARYDLEVFHVHDAQPLPVSDDLRVLLFTATRELLANAAKHAHAHTVEVTTRTMGNKCRITVADDGLGFELSPSNRPLYNHHGFGLFSIRQRLESLGGHMVIKSQRGEGTEVILEAPLCHVSTNPS